MIRKFKPLKQASKKRTKKNWKWHADINPDGRWKPSKRRVKSKDNY